ncbi:MAG: RagB/SusD family nutrient uptake outer membrane protein [Bacteroidales bacterium]|nr:RagB/SusD family nutrient uptake outer membrane protein [Bacteroidales bacterium]
MKKNLLYIALASLAFTACEDLDLRPEGTLTTPDQKEETLKNNPERAEAGVNAVFSGMSQYAPNYDVLGSVRHNDFGYASIMMFLDACSEDVITGDNGYNWAGNSLDFTDRVYTSNESKIIWNTLYSSILSANTVLSSIDENTEDPQLQYYMAQAKTTRAFMYLNLVQLYQFNYEGHENSPAVPLITDKNKDEAATNGCPRATVQEVYDQINDDLTKSIACLENCGISRPDKRYVSTAVAYGLRARMNLAMHKYAEAANDADKAIAAATDCAPATFNEINHPTFWDFSEKNWMWGIRVEETDDVVSSGLINWISHCGTFNYGYCTVSGSRQISKKLYNQISETDARKAWFSDGQGVNPFLSDAYNAYLVENEFYPYTSCKFAPYGGYADGNIGADTNANDVALMRIEEMYLIKAEGLARSGGDGYAVLSAFMTNFRDPQYSFPGTSGDRLINEILKQRRIELWGEGLIWFDIMRLNQGVDRRGCGFHEPTVIFNIEPNSPILLYRLPQTEIQANSAISEGDNNPVASAPDPVKDVE